MVPNCGMRTLHFDSIVFFFNKEGADNSRPYTWSKNIAFSTSVNFGRFIKYRIWDWGKNVEYQSREHDVILVIVRHLRQILKLARSYLCRQRDRVRINEFCKRSRLWSHLAMQQTSHKLGLENLQRKAKILHLCELEYWDAWPFPGLQVTNLTLTNGSQFGGRIGDYFWFAGLGIGHGNWRP